MKVKNFEDLMGKKLDLSLWNFAQEKKDIVYSGEIIIGLTKKVYKREVDGVLYSVAVFKFNGEEFCIAFGTEKMCMSHALYDTDLNFTERVFGCLDIYPVYANGVQTGFMLNEKYFFKKNSEVKVLGKLELLRLKFNRYRPIILFLLLTVFASFVYMVVAGEGGVMSFMKNYMAFFFIIFGMLKVINLKNFAKMFATYDLVARKFFWWGYIYPFLEVTLGFLYFFYASNIFLNLFVAILSLNLIIGIYKKISLGDGGKCACLGGFFNVPLSWLTIFENVVMFLMAVMMILM